jgi:hypothetical protein
MYTKECILMEPRVRDIVSIRVSPVSGNNSAVLLDIVVHPIHSTVPLNMVFPFYLEVA